MPDFVAKNVRERSGQSTGEIPMAHRIKCQTCNSCMSPVWIMPDRYYYCGFCHVYYAGRDGELQIVESPYKNYNNPSIVEDPVEDEQEISKEG